MREVLDLVQPYNRMDLNHGLGLLRDLNNFDKHRELVVTTTATASHVTSWWKGQPTQPPPHSTVFTHRPLKHDEVVAVVHYESPYLQPDPNLKFIPNIAFGDTGPVAREIVSIVLSDLAYLVEDRVIPLFAGFFAEDRRADFPTQPNRPPEDLIQGATQ